ncbi:LytTR family DNA-binding domain-containing protein [Phenylobacterium sp.]|uniref:LytTR family DNA-binding domain-containing protein n=1 Tax=Phenylobacterium sp. TaxID=1871053 RepID=UPI0025FEB76F|nr:LytTR family DNA-binding domain-containing protein [Phenylobacterium sp.]
MRVPIAQIQRIEAAKDYAIIHAAGRRHILRITMGELAQRVDPAQLMRVRRSAFVRLEAVRRVTRTGRGPMQLHLEDGAVVDVGPTYAKAVTRALRLQS